MIYWISKSYDQFLFEIEQKIQGVSADQLSLLILCLSILPLGVLFQFIKGQKTRKFISIVLGLFLQYLQFREQIYYVLIQSIIVYIIVRIFKRNCGKIVIIESLLFLSCQHLYRLFTDYGGWKLEITTISMFYVAKYSQFAFCVQDGTKQNQELEEMSTEQKLKKIDQMPSFIEYLSYIYFFGTSLMGPTYEFKDFQEYINLQGSYEKIPFKESLKGTFISLLRAGFFLIITIYASEKFPLNHLFAPEFMSYNYLYKILYLNISIIFVRTKYYSAWTMTESCMASTGLSFNSLTQKCDKIKTLEPEILETSTSIQDKAKYWNMTIQNWLNFYVHRRLYSKQEIKQSPAKAKRAVFITLLVSAFWHGFYPGYYLTFLQWNFLIEITKQFTKLIEDNNSYLNKYKNNLILKLLIFIISNTAFNYFAAGFVLLTFEPNLQYYKAFYYSINLLVIIFYIFSIQKQGKKQLYGESQKKIQNKLDNQKVENAEKQLENQQQN